MAWAALGSIGSAVAGSSIPIAGNYVKYRMDQSMQQDQNDFSERMSSSAYQRAVVDMKKAGLNPMLAYSQGGASTPSASQYSGSPNFGTDIVQGVSSALQSVNAVQDLENKQAQNDLIKAQAAKTNVESANVAGQTAMQQFQASALQASADASKANAAKTQQDTSFDAGLYKYKQVLEEMNSRSAYFSALQAQRDSFVAAKKAAAESRIDAGTFDALMDHFFKAIQSVAHR